MIEEFLAAERPRPLPPGATTELCTVLVSLYFELGDTVAFGAKEMVARVGEVRKCGE